MTKSMTMTLAQALEVIYAAGFGGAQEYGAVDWRMLTGSNDAVGFTAWPAGNPAETRYLFEFSMSHEGTVSRSELVRLRLELRRRRSCATKLSQRNVTARFARDAFRVALAASAAASCAAVRR
jgi:hypothetical protein